MQNKDGKLNEKIFYGMYSCGPHSMSHSQHITLNMDTKLDQPTVSSTVANVKPSAPSIQPQRKSTN
jgi:hypothetical protein